MWLLTRASIRRRRYVSVVWCGWTGFFHFSILSFLPLIKYLTSHTLQLSHIPHAHLTHLTPHTHTHTQAMCKEHEPLKLKGADKPVCPYYFDHDSYPELNSTQVCTVLVYVCFAVC
jgi:hypothetical protein